MSILTILTKTAATIGATGVIGTALWGIGDYTKTRPIILRELEQAQLRIDEISKTEVWLIFDRLNQKQKIIPLTIDEQAQLCQAAKTLNYPLASVPGCT